MEYYREVKQLRTRHVPAENWFHFPTVHPEECSKMSPEEVGLLSSCIVSNEQSLAELTHGDGQAQPKLADAINRLVKSLARYAEKTGETNKGIQLRDAAEAMVRGES